MSTQHRRDGPTAAGTVSSSGGGVDGNLRGDVDTSSQRRIDAMATAPDLPESIGRHVTDAAEAPKKSGSHGR